jgi:hypothetical protein
MPYSSIYIIMAVITVLFPIATLVMLVLIYVTLRSIENKIVVK